MRFLKTYQLFEKEISEIEQIISELETREVTEETADTFKNDMKNITNELIKAGLSEIETDKLANRIYLLNDKIPQGKRYFTKTQPRENKTKIESQYFTGKVKGDNISGEEFSLYINTLTEIFTNMYDNLSLSKDFEYKEIQAKHVSAPFKLSYWVFKFKQDDSKIKLKLLTKYVKPELKDDLLRELHSMNDISTEEGAELVSTINTMNTELEQNSENQEEKELISTEPAPDAPKAEREAQKQVDGANANTEKLVINPDNTFVTESVKLLLDEKLTKGLQNTDEDKIYDWFLGKYESRLKTLNASNIDNILKLYRQGVLKESTWFDDAYDKTKKVASNMQKSLVDTKSDGVIKDLMNAFNTNVSILNGDISEILKNYTAETQQKINSISKSGITVGNAALVVGAVYGARKLKGAVNSVKGKLGLVSSTMGKGALSGKLLTRNLWITGVALTAYAGYNAFFSILEQQKQLAFLMINFWASGSKEFINEANKAGIKFPEYSISMEAIQVYLNPTSAILTESEDKKDISALFKFLNKRKVDNKIAVSLVADYIGSNKVLFVVDKPMSENSKDIVNFYIVSENKYYSVNGEYTKEELMRKENLTKNTFNDKTFFGNSHKTKVILKELGVDISAHIKKEFNSIIK